MSQLAHDVALHPQPRREVSVKSPRALPPEPGARRPPIAVRARRRTLPRVLAAFSVRRRWGGPPRPASRESAGTGVSPIAGGATRGVAFLVNR